MTSTLIADQRADIFAQAIIKGKDQSASYLLAFPHAKKWKKKTLYTRASEYVRKSEVVGRINLLKQKAAKAFEYGLSEIVEDLYHIAMNDPAEMYDENGFVKDIHEIPKHVRKTLIWIEHGSINKIKVVNGVEVVEPAIYIEKYRQESRIQALGRLMEFKLAELAKPLPITPKADEIDKRQLARQLISLAYEGTTGK